LGGTVTPRGGGGAVTSTKISSGMLSWCGGEAANPGDAGSGNFGKLVSGFSVSVFSSSGMLSLTRSGMRLFHRAIL